MGTTCTAVWFVGHNKGVIAHVGDSRLYVLRSGALHQLSEDHTYVNELVKDSQESQADPLKAVPVEKFLELNREFLAARESYLAKLQSIRQIPEGWSSLCRPG